ncbi:protein-L-isoaspartate(D-aspartate) O-methyltransferase [Candidatus Desantisbacteria bacterium]|nr:protein-L-isoaspartate(D-aspartate) O-methyltransferase [Candidatus Desantisbacteria bacterium]
MKIIIFLFIVMLVLINIIYGSEKIDNYIKLREDMVEFIKQRGIKDEKVLDVMRKVKRHLFVPESMVENAYVNDPLPIGEGQTISQPYIVAFMTEVLNVKPDEKVLEIGTGSGYQAAILSELAKEVYTIEIIEVLGKKAEKTLKDLGYKNVKVKIGDGYKGWIEYAPYDVIIVTCAPDRIPEPLVKQLKDGGRMIIPVGESYNQELIMIEKINGIVSQKGVLPVIFVPMTGDGIKKH